MKAYLKFDFNVLTKKLLEEKLGESKIKFTITGFGEVEFLENLSPEKLEEMQTMPITLNMEISPPPPMI